MSTFKNPVGPEEPRVYWRRRLVVGLGIVVVLIVIISIVSSIGRASSSGPSGAATHTTAPPASPSTSATPGTTTGATAAACSPANIVLVPVADKATYAATEDPQISMTIVNNGGAACSMNLGSTQQELIITSGSETIWDSKDCQTAPVDTPFVLQPGKVEPTGVVKWDRTRSSTTTCSSTRAPVAAGGARYHLAVKVGAITSKTTAQFILN